MLRKHDNLSKRTITAKSQRFSKVQENRRCPTHRGKIQNDPNLKVIKANDGPDQRTLDGPMVHPVISSVGVWDHNLRTMIHRPGRKPWSHRTVVGCAFLEILGALFGGQPQTTPMVCGPTHGPWVAFVSGTYNI
uniref:Uncharacterized protein n=1 Tax=Solanum tuberosum TaxID=4113 RepID=M1DSN6_SOLTU